MKPIACVRLEGTLSTDYDLGLDDPGKPVESARIKLAALKAAYYVIILTPIARTTRGLRLVTDWLRSSGFDAYDELWEGTGIPSALVYVDDEAHKL